MKILCHGFQSFIVPVPFYPMATDKQKSYLKELIMSLPEEDGREELLNNLDSMTKEDESELIGQLKN